MVKIIEKKNNCVCKTFENIYIYINVIDNDIFVTKNRKKYY